VSANQQGTVIFYATKSTPAMRMVMEIYKNMKTSNVWWTKTFLKNEYNKYCDIPPSPMNAALPNTYTLLLPAVLYCFPFRL